MKTPISYGTNRAIGAVAPSKYLLGIESKGQVDSVTLDAYLESHWINPELCRSDNFNAFIIDRSIKLLNAIEEVTGRTITGRDSDEVVAAFGDVFI